MKLNHKERIVTKPWGIEGIGERWHVLTNDFCAKDILISQGNVTSLQKHIQKEEINFIRKGECELLLEDENGIIQKYHLKEGDSFFVPVNRIHRVIALTDLQMFEVSNKYVDDVIRLEDSYGREGMNIRIEDEHKTPAFVILAAGKGERVKSVTRGLHKGLLKVGESAAISYLIDKVPQEYDIIITLGYNGDLVKNYCLAAHPERKFIFSNVEDYEGPESGPGKSILAAKNELSRPFYFCTVDCIFDGKLPPMDHNWIGVSDTDLPEIYSTAKVDDNGKVVEFLNKSKDGFGKAFAGLAFIKSYKQFWDSLGDNKEIVYAFINRKFDLYTKDISWYDIGTVDGYSKVGKIPQKNLSEETYAVDGRFVKVNLDKEINKNRFKRAEILGDLVPKNVKYCENTLSYDFVNGVPLYDYDNVQLYDKLIDILFDNIRNSRTVLSNEANICTKFYHEKTQKRLAEYAKKYNEKEIQIDTTLLIYTAEFYKLFHGDLQPDNVIVDHLKGDLYYIDWRPDFGGQTQAGDIYYDLGKLYGGLLFNYKQAKDLNNLNNGIPQTENMEKSLKYFERRIEEEGYDLRHVKKMTGLIWLNMAPLHLAPMDKMLFENGLKLFNEN